MAEVGDAAPDFCLPAGDEEEVCLNLFQGKNGLHFISILKTIQADAPRRQ